jgi:hypothetical protein
VQYEGHHQCNGSTDIDPKYHGAQLWQEIHLLVKLQSDVKGVGWNQAYGLLAPRTALLQPAITCQFQVNSKVGLRWRLWAFFFPHLKPTRNLGVQSESAPGNVSQHLPFHSASCPLELQPAGFRKNCMSFNDHAI